MAYLGLHRLCLSYSNKELFKPQNLQCIEMIYIYICLFLVEKENIPDNRQLVPPQVDEQPLIPDVVIHPSSPEMRVTTLLQEAGLADMEMRPEVQIEEESQRKSRKHGSESSETMLGSLDRTKVSLGDSEHTTESKRFIR